MAPRKLVPQSENISLGLPRRLVKRLKAARKHSVESEPTTSMCTALVVKHTKIANQHLRMTLERTIGLIEMGPA